MFKRILDLNLPNGYDPEFAGEQMYISVIRTCIYDLKNYDIYFFEENSSGNDFLSHILLQKLTFVFKKEIIHNIGHNYQKIVRYILQLFACHKEISQNSRNYINEKPSTAGSSEKVIVHNDVHTLKNYENKSINLKW